MTSTKLNGIISITNSTDSEDYLSGALTVVGGVGVSQNLTVGREVSSDTALLSSSLTIKGNTNASSSTSGGTITTAGGAAIAKDLYVGGKLYLPTAFRLNTYSRSGTSQTCINNTIPIHFGTTPVISELSGTISESTTTINGGTGTLFTTNKAIRLMLFWSGRPDTQFTTETGNSLTTYVYVNGSRVFIGSASIRGAIYTFSGSCIINLSASDTFMIIIEQYTGTSAVISNQSASTLQIFSLS